MIDIHTHLLPEVDDGPKTWETSVEMCRMAAYDGITHIVATPHANDRYHYDRPFLSGLLDHLRELVGDSPQLTLGCDFHLSYDNLQSALDRPHTYTIGETNYLLVELSNYSVPPQMRETLANAPSAWRAGFWSGARSTCSRLTRTTPNVAYQIFRSDAPLPRKLPARK